MKSLKGNLIQFLIIFALRSANDAAQVEGAVGLYGPDRYEGIPEICLMPMDFGYCRAKVQRYYFDIRRMKCNMFFWGGCAGNDNNFKSIEECNDFCGSHYEDHVQNEVVAVAKKERTEGRGTANTKNNVVKSRDSGVPKSVPKVVLKPNVTSKETGYKGPFKASAKSFNVNPPPASNSSNSDDKLTDTIDEEVYDE